SVPPLLPDSGARVHAEMAAIGVPGCATSAGLWGAAAAACFGTWPEREGHRAGHHHLPVHASVPVELPHSAPEPFHPGLDLDHVSGVDRPPVADAVDPGKEGELLAVLGLGQD